MNSPRSFLTLSLLFLIFVTASACRAATPTVVPPTDAPSAVLITPTATPDSARTLADAIDKVKQLKVWRFEMDWSGNPGYFSGPFEMHVKLEKNGENSHVINKLNTTYSSASDEVIFADGKSYVRGPNMGRNAPEDKWYLYPEGVGGLTIPTTDMFASLLETVHNSARLRAETFDNLSCQVFAASKEDAVKLHSQWLGYPVQTVDAARLAGYTVAEAKSWICEDGYPHQLQMNVVMEYREQALKYVESVSLHIYDIDGDVSITAPTDAVPAIPTPSPVLPPTWTPAATPTPTMIPADATATMQAVQTGRADAMKWPVVFTDTFDSNVNRWPLEEPDKTMSATAVVEGGLYRWTASPAQSAMLWETPENRIAQADLYLSVEARRMTGSAANGYGIVFRENPSHDSFYAFLINDEGKYELFLVRQLTISSVIDWTESTAIRRGEKNRLAVIAQGAHLTLFINDQAVAELSDDRLKSGGIGVAFDVVEGEKSVIEFDKIEARAP